MEELTELSKLRQENLRLTYKLKELELENKLNSPVKTAEINYKKEYEFLCEKTNSLEEENELLRKALMNIALKLK